MRNRIGLRREDKNEWERRAVLTPTEVAAFVRQGIEIWVERSSQRVFADDDYAAAGAKLVDDVRPCELVFGVKEIPLGYTKPGGSYVFFSHTIKGQPHNLPMLRELVENECTLIDYEKITDDDGNRLIFFSYHAGVVGMVDSLWTLGRRMQALGHPSPLLELQPAHRYASLDSLKTAVSKIANSIATQGLPAAFAPYAIGITGYGRVSGGAQEILDLFTRQEVPPDELSAWIDANPGQTKTLAKVVYREEHLVQPSDPRTRFELQEYYDHPELYTSVFEPHLAHLTMLVNAIYWEERYPRLASVDQLRQLFSNGSSPRLLVVGDISCDVDGSIAATVKETDPGDPVYLYDPQSGQATNGFEGEGLAVMSVGILPSELPVEASETFGRALVPFVPDLAEAQLDGSLDASGLPAPLARATILWRGDFTEPFFYMEDFL